MTTYINWSNVTDMSQVPAQANLVSDGGFWVAMLFMIWIIALILLMNYGFEVALLGSSFSCLLLGTLLTYGGLMSWQWLMTFLAVILFTIMYIIYNSRQNR